MYSKLFLMLFALTTLTVHAEKPATDQKEGSEVLLGLKTVTGSRKTIVIKIPPDFIPLKGIADGTEKFYEFIPAGESSAELASEAITILQKPCAKSLTQTLKYMAKKHKANKAKCSYRLAEENGVEIAFLTADYSSCILNSSSNELFMMKIVQGKDDMTAIQFSARYENNKEKIQAKLLDFLNSCSMSVHSEEPATEQKPAAEVLIRLKPIAGARKSILVKVPSNFVPLSGVSLPKEMFYEFIPDGENPELWNELIAITQTPCANNSLIQLLKGMKTQYQASGKQCSYRFVEENGMKVGFVTADYPVCIPHSDHKKNVTISGKTELLLMKIVQEKDGFSHVQFSVRHENNITPEAKEKIQAKMLDFLNSCEIK